MAMERPVRVNKILNGGIRKLAGGAYRFYRRDPKGRAFMRTAAAALKAQARLRAAREKAGQHIPPFLIASVTSSCNLRCAGCYAMAAGHGAEGAGQMSAEDWARLFDEARDAGVSFALLAGGEPLMRRDVMEEAARRRGMIFPVFTNGTLIDTAYLRLFDENRHLIPILSLEGGAEMTDRRRGAGVSALLSRAMDSLQGAGLLFGASITVTSENMTLVTSPEFAEGLRKRGCGIIFFVEYVPAQVGSEALVLSEARRREQEERLASLRARARDMAVIAFPGDEAVMGGCLAAGRGFFHVNPAGGAEPCPFASFSDTSLKTHSFLEALRSPLFAKLRERGLLNLPHGGGCALFGREETIRALLNETRTERG